MEKYQGRLTYEELARLQQDDPEEFERVTFGSKKDFIFGIWRLGCLEIVLNRKFIIPLRRKPTTGFPFAVGVDEEYGSQTVVNEDERVIFYLWEEEFQQILRDAEYIESEYTREGITLCRLPDVWFEDTHLVWFLRQRVVVHPMYLEWKKRIGHVLVGT